MSPYGPFTRMLNEAIERRKADATKRGGLQDLQIAIAVGITESQFSNYKHGQLPRDKHRVEALADALKVDRTEMLIAWAAQASIHVSKHSELANVLRQLVDVVGQKASLLRKLPPEILESRDTGGKTMLQSLDELDQSVSTVRQVFDWPADDLWRSEEEGWIPDFRPVDAVDYAIGEGMVSSDKEAEWMRNQTVSRLAEQIPVSILLRAVATAIAGGQEDAGAGRLLAGAFGQQDLVDALACSVELPAESIALAVRALGATKRETASEKPRSPQ